MPHPLTFHLLPAPYPHPLALALALSQIHTLKFIPDEDVKRTTENPERLKPFFSFRTPSRRTAPHEVSI